MVFTKGQRNGLAGGTVRRRVDGMGLVKVIEKEASLLSASQPPWLPLVPVLPLHAHKHAQTHTHSLNHTGAHWER